MICSIAAQSQVSNFDSLITTPNKVLNGSGATVSATFISGNCEFANEYQTAFGGYWSKGWAYSNRKNDTTAGFNNLYASYAKGGFNSNNYAIGQNGSRIAITGTDKGKIVKGIYVTNSTYAALSMKNGDAFAKKFGGASGNDPDFFMLSIKAYFNGTLSNNAVQFYLADFRDANNALDSIRKSWSWIDLSSLGNVDSLIFTLTSSDTGQFGMNTPAFFCIDQIITESDTADFENLALSTNSFWNKRNMRLNNEFKDGWSTLYNSYNTASFGDFWSGGFAISTMQDTTTAGFQNLYSSYAGRGATNSTTYAVGQNRASLKINAPPTTGTTYLSSIDVTNTTYASLSMKNGDAFAKKFGGATGNDSDYFLLTIKGFKYSAFVDSINFYLADYRFVDNSQDYILKNWATIDLTEIQFSDSLVFFLTSSDNGQFGMNTPAFFALDNIRFTVFGGLKNATHDIHFAMYPNPATDIVNINIDEPNATIKVVDITGKVYIEQDKNSDNHSMQIDQLPAGLYFVNVQTAKGTGVQKLIVY